MRDRVGNRWARWAAAILGIAGLVGPLALSAFAKNLAAPVSVPLWMLLSGALLFTAAGLLAYSELGPSTTSEDQTEGKRGGRLLWWLGRLVGVPALILTCFTAYSLLADAQAKSATFRLIQAEAQGTMDQNLDNTTGIFEDDATVVEAIGKGRIWLGKDEIRERYRSLFTDARIVNLSHTGMKFRRVSATEVVVTAVTNGQVISRNGSAPIPLDNDEEWTFRHHPGLGWRVFIFRYGED